MINMVNVENLPSYVNNTTSNPLGKDITKEFEVDKEDVDICSIEELVPSSTPLTIPYLEIYRTNELEYIPYMSPYNVGVSSSDSSSSGDTSSNDTSSNDSNSSTNGDDSNSNDSSNSSDSGSSNSSSNSGGNSTNVNP